MGVGTGLTFKENFLKVIWHVESDSQCTLLITEINREGAWITNIPIFSSVQFSRSVMSDSSGIHESKHARLPCPSPTPGVHSNSCPSSQWCHPDISSSVIPFSSCPQSLQASGSFPKSQLFAWRGQSIGVSASTSVVFLLFNNYWKIQVITWSHHCL